MGLPELVLLHTEAEPHCSDMGWSMKRNRVDSGDIWAVGWLPWYSV
jgi:hypothetical protein